MIKKIVIGMLLAYGTVANAGTYFLDNAKKMKIETPYNLLVADNITDFELASFLGNTEYIKKALKTDPDIVKKINNVMARASTADSLLGFNSKNAETLAVMMESDKELLIRKNGDQRNILINLLVQHHEFFHSEEPKKEVEMLIKDLENRKFPFAKESKEPLLAGRPIQEMEQFAMHLTKILPTTVLNESDKWGNNALGYAIYIRKPNIVKGLLNNPNFKAINAQNYMGENAYFMLLNNNCNVVNDKKSETEMLRGLLYTRLNPLQKNQKGVSFAGMVYAFNEFSHLKQVLSDNLGPLKTKLAEREAAYIKEVLSTSNSKAVKNSFATSFSNSREYTIYTCDVSKLNY